MYSLPTMPTNDSIRFTSRSASRNPPAQTNHYNNWGPTSLTNSYHGSTSRFNSNKNLSYSKPHKNNGPSSMTNSYHEPSYSYMNNENYDMSDIIPKDMKRTTSLKNAFYPPNTSMTNLNRSFSAR